MSEEFYILQFYNPILFLVPMFPEISEVEFEEEATQIVPAKAEVEIPIVICNFNSIFFIIILCQVIFPNDRKGFPQALIETEKERDIFILSIIFFLPFLSFESSIDSSMESEMPK